jgi:flagellar L-ring protein FlgH
MKPIWLPVISIIFSTAFLIGSRAGAESLSGLGNTLSSASASLFSTEKIYHEGDLITVLIVENAQGSQSANTDLSKEASVGLTTGGVVSNVVGSGNLGLFSRSKGNGELGRQGSMTAMITARVEKILENGNLLVKGDQSIEFDSGLQRISLEGIVRPRDITATNEILSSRLANAKIEFTGDGALHEKARTGFLGRFLEWLWIF